jgi:hypothetical protein
MQITEEVGWLPDRPSAHPCEPKTRPLDVKLEQVGGDAGEHGGLTNSTTNCSILDHVEPLTTVSSTDQHTAGADLRGVMRQAGRYMLCHDSS